MGSELLRVLVGKDREVREISEVRDLRSLLKFLKLTTLLNLFCGFHVGSFEFLRVLMGFFCHSERSEESLGL